MKKYIIGNLKMNLLSIEEREKYLHWVNEELGKLEKDLENVELVLCPPFVHLEGFTGQENGVKLGAQNMLWEEKGSYTGEISPIMLKNFGCEYVILGHSERRKYFSENNEDVNLKLLLAIKNGLKPVLCVGETAAERDAGKMADVVASQVRECLQDFNRTKAQQLIVVYEPVWAVGVDVVPTVNEIMEARLFIKKILAEMMGKKYMEQVAILYGGNANLKNIKDVCLETGMEGILVGRESLNPHELVRMGEVLNIN